jgi:hypothetical protein
MNQGRGVVRIGRPVALALFAATMVPCAGCGLTPHAFRKFQHPEGLVRARAVGSSQREPDSTVVPALVKRLNDEDPVVRLAANEELRKRTGRDFGYVPWASAEERTAAIGRWHSWLTGPPMPAGPIRAADPSVLPVKAPAQAAGRQTGRRRRQTPTPQPSQPPQPIPQPSPTTENAPS